MNFKIHRGTKEIGGSCVEVWTANTRIIIDMGMPLVNSEGNQFSFSEYKKLDVNELVEQKILPDIKGLYNLDEKPIDGVFISHAHLDHFGFMNYVSDNVKIYLGQASHTLINTFNIFTSNKYKISNYSYFEKEKSIQIGDIKITPYWNDHSAFDAYSFLIEADGKAIFYSGDFRGHGRKAKAFQWFLHNAPQNVDYLLLEGTTIGRNAVACKTEKEIEQELFELFSIPGKINLIYTAGQNIDRLVSIFRACRRANKIFVMDVYVATILTELSEYASLPLPSKSFKEIRVMFPRRTCNKLKADGNESYMYRLKEFKITKEEISEHANDIVMLVRPSMIGDIERINNLKDGNFVYSMWDGYLKKKDTSDFMEYFKKLDFEIHKIHTSGHADDNALQDMVTAINPQNIVPIHTFESASYSTMFKQNVVRCDDGETIEIQSNKSIQKGYQH